MNEIDVTWGRAAKVWWSLLWRSLLFAGVAGFGVGVIVGVVGAIVGASREAVSVISFFAGLGLGVPIGIWVVKLILTKNYSDFRVALVPRTESTLSE